MSWMTKDWKQGELNALVKNIGGETVARRIQRGDKFTLVFEDQDITHHVTVDRSRNPEQVIDRTGRHKWYIDPEVLTEMPRDGLDENNVIFFELDYDPTVDELDREYEARGLKPDPYAVAQVVTDDPSLADERPVAVQWRDKHGRACCAIFSRGGDQRGVSVGRGDGG